MKYPQVCEQKKIRGGCGALIPAELISPGFEQKKLSFESQQPNISISLKFRISERLCKTTDDSGGRTRRLESYKASVSLLLAMFLMAVKWPLASF